MVYFWHLVTAQLSFLVIPSSNWVTSCWLSAGGNHLNIRYLHSLLNALRIMNEKVKVKAQVLSLHPRKNALPTVQFIPSYVDSHYVSVSFPPGENAMQFIASLYLFYV